MKKMGVVCGIGLEILVLIMALGFCWKGIEEEHSLTANSDSSSESNTKTEEEVQETEGSENKKDYIKWVEFHVTCDAMKKACSIDVDTYGTDMHLNWIDLLAYLGAKYGGDFRQYKAKDIEEIAEKLKSGESDIARLSSEMKYFDYYREAYGAVLEGLVGEYKRETVQEGDGEEKAWVTEYGLKGYSPIAKGFPYSDYDDFGVSRTYGYRRNHLGHDLMGQTGTPIIAVESGYVKAMGWNQYGGWRLGISSFDGIRYYYYAHLRQNFPYCKSLKEGSVVQAGDVIGYMGHTGYSTKENVNNIDTTHLHFGLQLIFDESQREGNHEIWVDAYELVKFLYQNQSEVIRDDTTKEWKRVCQIEDPEAVKYSSQLKKGEEK